MKNTQIKGKIKALHVYIMCNNNQVKEYDVIASRKFNIGDETYVIKEKCCYLKKIGDVIKEVAYYFETNPNPFNLKNIAKNYGLNEKELDKYIGGDLHHILMECQNQDRSKYIFPATCFVFALGVITFISNFF